MNYDKLGKKFNEMLSFDETLAIDLGLVEYSGVKVFDLCVYGDLKMTKESLAFKEKIKKSPHLSSLMSFVENPQEFDIPSLISHIKDFESLNPQEAWDFVKHVSFFGNEEEVNVMEKLVENSYFQDIKLAITKNESEAIENMIEKHETYVQETEKSVNAPFLYTLPLMKALTPTEESLEEKIQIKEEVKKELDDPYNWDPERKVLNNDKRADVIGGIQFDARISTEKLEELTNSQLRHVYSKIALEIDPYSMMDSESKTKEASIVVNAYANRNALERHEQVPTMEEFRSYKESLERSVKNKGNAPEVEDSLEFPDVKIPEQGAGDGKAPERKSKHKIER